MIRQWIFSRRYRKLMGLVLCFLLAFHVSNFIVNVYYGNTDGKGDNHRHMRNADSKENYHKDIMRNNNESHHGHKETNAAEHDEVIKDGVIKEDFRNKLDILKMVPYSHSKTIASYGEHVTFEQKESRMQEIVESIRKTLIHPEVGKVYLFYQDELLIPYMEKQNLDHKEKMVFVPNMEDTMATLFRYANEHLDGHVVMVMNADTYPDEGFEKLDFTRLRGKNLIYSLSRYGRKEKNCDHTKDGYSNKCTRKGFVGSMDAYLFSPKASFKEEHYKAISYPPRHPGIENVICWVFSDLKYRILNPCEVLKIYHIHCGVRLKLGQRINLRHSHSAFPGNQLY